MDIMKNLIDELNLASQLYYNGKDSFLTDKEFDTRLAQLQKLEKETGVVYSNSPTINVGAKVLENIPKIKINDKPMLSLAKVHSAEEIYNFWGNTLYDIAASIKCDGLSVRLIYENGTLISANTRGDGYEGSDITEHIKYFKNVPLYIDFEDKLIVDGEAIIYDKDFEIINKNNEFKNNRNTASGALALLDMTAVKQRRLSFLAWDTMSTKAINDFCGFNYNSYSMNMEILEELGFDIVPFYCFESRDIEIQTINELNEELINLAKEKGIPCDGVVWKINDTIEGEKLGQTAHHFLNAVAWKPANDEYETKLKYIDYDVSRNGVLTPVAVFEPVEIDGSTVERASLHNLSIMQETLGEYPERDQKIWVAKMNMIIPQITRALKNDIPHDHIIYNGFVLCPVCGHLTTIIKSGSGVKILVCPNDECPGKLAQRIDYYCSKKGLDIKGLSRMTIEKLIDWGWLETIEDIYYLKNHKLEWEEKPGFGSKSVTKILNAIEDSKNNVNLADFISALGIPLVGKTIAKEIVKYFETWSDFRSAVGGDWTEFDGFGPEINNAINKFDYSDADLIAEMLDFKAPEVVTVNSTPFEGLTFCVTGKLQNYSRDSIKAEIEKLGGKVSSGVSAKTNYLITNTPDSGTAKNRDAQKLNIPIITEQEYMALIQK